MKQDVYDSGIRCSGCGRVIDGECPGEPRECNTCIIAQKPAKRKYQKTKWFGKDEIPVRPA